MSAIKNSPPNALARVERRFEIFAEDPAWQRIWLNLESEDWRSLAVIPAGDLSAIELVHGLAAVAWQQRGTSVIVADLRSISLPALHPTREELRRRVHNGERILIATQSLDKNPTSAAIAREADKSLLCVFVGRSSRASVQSAIREIGIQRCLGTIMIRASG